MIHPYFHLIFFLVLYVRLDNNTVLPNVFSFKMNKHIEHKSFLQTFSALSDCDFDLITDLTIITRNGRIETFQALFSWMSSSLRRMFTSKFVMEDYGRRKDPITLFLPDIDSSNIKQIISLMTAGECHCVSGDFQNLNHVWEMLNIDRLKLSSLVEENVAQSTRNNVIPSAVYPNAPLDLTTNPKNEQNSDNESIQLPLSFTKSCWRSFLVKFLKLRMEKS